MFAYFYQLCILIFLLQGILSPFLAILSGGLWVRQNHRLEKFKRNPDISRGKQISSSEASELILNGLPKLEPLNCDHCGAGVLLKGTESFCPNCHTHSQLPADYAAAVSLKSQVRSLLKSAVRHWRVANVLTNTQVGRCFFLMILIEPLVLFPTVVIGSNVFTNTWIDKAFGALGEPTTLVIMLSAFFGFVIWMVVFIFLSSLSKSLRRKLPLVPVFENEIRGIETAGCEACGGAIEYDAGDFACICSYCNVENFRVRFARRARARAETQKTKTGLVLFGAMEILEDFVGTFFIVLVILVGASIVLTAFYAIKNLR